MNKYIHTISRAAIAVAAIGAGTAAAHADIFESLYDRKGIEVVYLNSMVLNDVNLSDYVYTGGNDFDMAFDKLNSMTIISAEKGAADIKALSKDINNIIKNITPSPETIVRVIEPDERVTIYGVPSQAGSSTITRMIILSQDDDELNLINIDGCITISN